MNTSAVSSPCAEFVVEREPGRGYVVTKSEGPRAGLLRDRALAVLDALGHLDPAGPDTFSRLLGPIAPTGEYVSVVVRRTQTGEARYEQTWFTAATSDPRKAGAVWWSALLLGVLVGVGVTLGLRLVTESKPLPQSQGESGVRADSVPQPPGKDPNGAGSKAATPSSDRQPANHPIVAELRARVERSRIVRSKLADYLSQDGFAATKEVVEQKRSVKVTSDLDDFGKPKVESIRLNNVEVAELVDLLKWLEVSVPVTPGGPSKP